MRRIFLRLIPKDQRTAQRGASLISLAIFLTALGIITGGSLQIYRLYQFRSAEDTTRKHLDIIETALMDYFEINGRLPCAASPTAKPDTNKFGHEIASKQLDVNYNSFSKQYEYSLDGSIRFERSYEWKYPTTCKNTYPDSSEDTSFQWGPLETLKTVRIGSVPTRTLGIDDKFMLDGWGHRIVYAIDTDAVHPDYWAENGDDPGAIYVIDDLEIKYPVNIFQSNEDSLALYNSVARENHLKNESVTTPEGGAIYLLIAPGKDPRGAYNLQGSKIESCEIRTKAWENCDYDQTAGSLQGYCIPRPNFIFSTYNECTITGLAWENGDNVFINFPQKTYDLQSDVFTATLRYKAKFRKGRNE